jgi:dipeptidyl aminopeptidase/acylaminoacyl peptidase
MRTIGVVLVAAVIGVVAVGKAWTRPAAGAVQCLAAQPAAAAFPTWAPSADRLAFTVPKDETGAIVTAEPAGRYRGELAESWDSAPEALSWAPVGTSVAFLKRTGAIAITNSRQNSFGVEIVHAEHNTLTELGDWSPNGRLLAFVRDGHIYTVDVLTWEIRHVVDGFHPTWSPDGVQLAFATAAHDPPGPPHASMDLVVVHPDGSGRRTLVTDAPQIDSIAWSPDSTRLAFAGAVIGLVRSDGGPAVYREPGQRPLAWRATGIFYNLEGPSPRGIHAMRFDPDTGRTTELIHLPRGFEGTFAAASPDGRRIAYALDRSSLRVGLRIVGADGRNDVPLVACFGTGGPDRIRGSRLNDVIRARGGGLDRITCGPGHDTVYADRRDRVARDCETVRAG